MIARAMALGQYSSYFEPFLLRLKRWRLFEIISFILTMCNSGYLNLIYVIE